MKVVVNATAATGAFVSVFFFVVYCPALALVVIIVILVIVMLVLGSRRFLSYRMPTYKTETESFLWA